MNSKIVIDQEKCVSCGLCAEDCPNRCISLENKKARADTGACIECGHCFAICPQNAVSMAGYDCADEPVVPMTEVDSDTFLAAIKSRRSIRRFTAQPDKMILLSPWLDVSMSNPEIEDYESADPMLSAYGLIEMGKCWAGDLELTDYRISPIYGDISALRNVYLFVGTREIFYPDVTLFYSMLQEQGVSAELYIGEGMNHDYPLYPIPEADDAIEQMCSII